MSFKHKLAIVIWTIVILLVCNSIFFVYELKIQTPLLSEESEAVDELSTKDIKLLKLSQRIKFNTVQVQQWLTDISATRAMDGLNDGFEVAQEFANKFNEDVKAAKIIAKEDNYKETLELLKEAEKAFPQYYQIGKKMARAYVDYGPQAGNKIMSEFDSGAEKINSIVNQLEVVISKKTDKQIQHVEENILKLKNNNKTIISIVYYLSGISVIIAIISSIYLIRLTSFKFSALKSDIQNTADKKYDMDLKLNPENSDEFGELAKNILDFRDSLKRADEIAKEQEQMKKKSEEDRKKTMHDLANKFESRVSGLINSVASAATELNHTAESMGGNISNVDNKAKDTAISSKETTQNVHTVASASEEMAASVREISSQITKSTEVVNEAVKKADDAGGSAMSLKEATTQMSNVIKLIRDITEQINLLALNATIEAARAGEAGKGFSVVAAEVKNLATQTTQATEDISKQIEGVQNISTEVADALNSIKTSVDKVNEYSGGISAAAEEQSATTDEIAKNMQIASQGVQKVTENVTHITEYASQAKDSSVQVLDASKTLSKESEELSVAVSTFLSEIREG